MNLLNISIDDVSPHPHSSLDVLRQCEKIHSVFPDARFTLFVPTAYWRTMRAGIATERPLVIDKHDSFADALCRLANTGRFEICYHGHYHGIPHISDNDEFATLNYAQAHERLTDMINIANSLDKSVFKPIFRPPAWRMSPDSFRAADDLGMRMFALSSREYAQNTYKGANMTHNVVYYTAAPPNEPLELVELTEIVYHACEWDVNYLSDERVNELLEFLTIHVGKYRFAFIEELI